MWQLNFQMKQEVKNYIAQLSNNAKHSNQNSFMNSNIKIFLDYLVKYLIFDSNSVLSYKVRYNHNHYPFFRLVNISDKFSSPPLLIRFQVFTTYNQLSYFVMFQRLLFQQFRIKTKSNIQ